MSSKEVKDTARRRPPNAGKGRPKGAKNKTTLAVKEALQIAFDARGGAKGLLDWSKENPTEFYKLWGKLLPQEIKNEVTGKDGGAIGHALTIRVVRETKAVRA